MAWIDIHPPISANASGYSSNSNDNGYDWRGIPKAYSPDQNSAYVNNHNSINSSKFLNNFVDTGLPLAVAAGAAIKTLLFGNGSSDSSSDSIGSGSETDSGSTSDLGTITDNGFTGAYENTAKIINDTAKANNEWSANEAEKLRNWQVELANTAHQREVADLKAAGLNPVLSAGGTGAATPSGAMGQVDTSNTKAIADLAMVAIDGMANTARGFAAAHTSDNAYNLYKDGLFRTAGKWYKNNYRYVNSAVSNIGRIIGMMK